MVKLKNPEKRIRILIYITVFALAVFMGLFALFFVRITDGIKKIQNFRMSFLMPKKPSSMEMFIDKEFQELKIGMSEEDVLYKLGNPLGKATSASWDIWCYGLKKIKEPHRFRQASSDINLYFSENRILYFSQGKLAEIEMSHQGSWGWPKYYYIQDNQLYTPMPSAFRTTYGYSIAFSEERFGKVQKGMTKQQVIDLLGAPMGMFVETAETERWVYGYGRGAHARKIVERFVYITNNQVSNIEKTDQSDW